MVRLTVGVLEETAPHQQRERVRDTRRGKHTGKRQCGGVQRGCSGASVPAHPCRHHGPAVTLAVLVGPPHPCCSWAIPTAIPFAIPSAVPTMIPIVIHFAIPSAIPTAIPFAIPTASPRRTSGLALPAHHRAWCLSQPWQGPWQRPVLRDERDPMTFFFFNVRFGRRASQGH